MLNGTKQHKKWQGRSLPWPKYRFLWVIETDEGFVLTGCKHPNRPTFIHTKYSCGAMRKWKEWRRKLCSFILISVKKPDKTPNLQKGRFRNDHLSFAVLFSNILSLRCCSLHILNPLYIHYYSIILTVALKTVHTEEGGKTTLTRWPQVIWWTSFIQSCGVTFFSFLQKENRNCL